MSKKASRFCPEVGERAVPMVQEHRGESSLWAGVESITPKIGCMPQTLDERVGKLQIDTGVGDGVSSQERDRRLQLNDSRGEVLGPLLKSEWVS